MHLTTAGLAKGREIRSLLTALALCQASCGVVRAVDQPRIAQAC